jgi:hypothetical protein
MLIRIFLRSRSPFKIPEGRTLLALGRRGSNAQSHFPSLGVKRSIALGRRGSNAQSHFPSPAPTQNSEVE